MAKSRFYFNNSELDKNLASKSVRGGLFTVAGRGANFFINIFGTVILARLLTPEDFGLVAMVGAITSLILVLKDGGLSMASVQSKDLTHEQSSNLFWCNLVLGIALMLITAALAPLIALFYNEPRLVAITVVVAVGLIFQSLTAQPMALLKRHMHLGRLECIMISAQVIGLAVAITMAVSGVNYWALVARQLTVSISMCVIIWFAVPWKPGRFMKGLGTRKMLQFGANLTGSRFLTNSVRKLDNILIGAVSGASALGFYTKAYSLLMLPISQINGPLSSVAIPSLSRLQDQPDRFLSYYKQAIGTVALFSVPILIFCFVAAEELILSILGSQWEPSIALFRALTPFALVGALNVATAWLFIPLGRTDKQFKAALVWAFAIIAAMLLGIQWGALGVAIALSISSCIARIFHLIYACHGSPVSFRDFVSSVATPHIAALTAGLAAWFIPTFQLSNFLLLAQKSLVFGAIYMTLTASFGLWNQFFKHLKSLRSPIAI